MEEGFASALSLSFIFFSFSQYDFLLLSPFFEKWEVLWGEEREGVKSVWDYQIAPKGRKEKKSSSSRFKKRSECLLKFLAKVANGGSRRLIEIAKSKI